MQKSPLDLIFCKNFQIKNQISAGSFGEVFICINIMTQQELAIKLEPFTQKEDSLRSVLRESALLQKMQEIKGIPKIFQSGTENGYDFMIMELLGKDFASLLKIHKIFSLKIVGMLAEQLLTILEQVHEKNIVHRDIKPENVLVGKEGRFTSIYLLDFGISKFYRDGSHRHIVYRDKKPFIGTTRYASVNSHKGIELTRRDDLESLGYMLLFFANGSLPWQNLKCQGKEKNMKVGEMKERITNPELCKGLPKEFWEYFNYVKNMAFKKEPDYQYLKGLFQRVHQENAATPDFDWNTGKSRLKKGDEVVEKKGKGNFSLFNLKIRSSDEISRPRGFNKPLPSLKSNEHLLLPPRELKKIATYNSSNYTASFATHGQSSIMNFYVNSHQYLPYPELYENGKFLKLFLQNEITL